MAKVWHESCGDEEAFMVSCPICSTILSIGPVRAIVLMDAGNSYILEAQYVCSCKKNFLAPLLFKGVEEFNDFIKDAKEGKKQIGVART